MKRGSCEGEVLDDEDPLDEERLLRRRGFLDDE